MADVPVPIQLFLGVIAVCLLATTVALCSTAWELRTTLRFGRQLLARVGRTAARVEAVAGRLSDEAAGILEYVAAVGRRVRNVFGASVGNGAGADPRRRHRRR